MIRRSTEKAKAKNQQTMTQYYIVIGVFVVTMIAIVLYSIFDPKETIAQKLIVDDAAIMIHNNKEVNFSRAPNEQFEVSQRQLIFKRAKLLKTY
jgi:hypothetical protein